jgi:hypothetical protein
LYPESSLTLSPFNPFSEDAAAMSTALPSEKGENFAPPPPSKAQIEQNVVVVDNVAFADAVSKSQVRPFSKRMLQLYMFCLVATLNSCINGYDGSLMGSINAMEPYQHQFGMNTTGATTGFVFAIYTVGNICGSFIAGPVTVGDQLQGSLSCFKILMLRS